MSAAVPKILTNLSMKFLLPGIILLLALQVEAANFPRVDAAISHYDQILKEAKAKFSRHPVDPQSRVWVLKKLEFMFKIDQDMRDYWQTPFRQKFSQEESEYFRVQFLSRNDQLDGECTRDLKELLKIYTWFKISEWGKKYDNIAWLIVQHADLDVPFQKEILVVLENLYPAGETNPSNYAYLFDRVASSSNDLSKRVPQRYGTQGRCVGPSTWEAWPIEDEFNVDMRRQKMGLGTMDEYKKMFKDICH